MIVCDRFAFLHLHKSGGTFVNQLLLNCVPSARQIGYHLPYREMPAEFRGLPVLGTVRNPWAYYVSWYHFQRGQSRPNALFLLCSENRELDFKGTVTNLATLHADSARIARLADYLPDNYRKAGLNLTKSCIVPLGGSGLGFYSFLYHRHYDGAAAPRLMKVERLREELRSALVDLLGSVDERSDLFLASVPDLNRSTHGAHADYYDADLRDLVAEMDGDVIHRHGYSFEDATNAQQPR